MPINITMPALSPTMTQGNLATWLKAEGDTVSSGDVIAEIETDKATMEVEAVEEGILGKILVPAGTQNVPVNDVIAVLLEDGEKFDESMIKAASPAPSSKVEEASPVMSKSIQTAPAPASPTAVTSGRVFASPLAKRIAADKGINLSTIKGSGPHGRIVKADVENAPAQGMGAQQNTVSIPSDAKTNIFGMPYIELPNNNIKKITAQRLTEAKQDIPHFYLSVECILDELLAARKAINEKADGAYKLSVNDFIIKASALALQDFPAANVSWNDEAVHQFFHSDISIAVATPNGLITPIIKQAESKSLPQISMEMKELAARARDGKLKPEEFQGGTFSISNLGMFGVKDFAAILNPPQSCILAVGAGVPQPVVEDGELVVRSVMNVTLSTDHRSVDGAVGAQWLQHFKAYIENPITMFV